MAKRFADTEIWNKDWFLDLTMKQKLLVKYVFDNCDCAGIYEISYRNLKTCFGIKIQKEDFEKIKQFKFLENGKIYIEDFIQFQYGVSIDCLNQKNNVHKGIFKSLNKNSILPTLSQPLANPCPRVLDKDKDKDKDNIHESCSNTLSEEKEKISIFEKVYPESPIIKEIEKYHKKKFKKSATYLLSAKQKQEICRITNENKLTFGHWKQIIKNASGGWIVNEGGNGFKKVKPCFDKILEKWERFYNNEYNLEKAEPDEEEQKKDIGPVKSFSDEERAEITRKARENLSPELRKQLEFREKFYGTNINTTT